MDPSSMDYAGLIFDESFHYIDHLGPFCALMKWPLIVCEDRIGDSARRYYPNLQVIQKNIWELELPKNILSCDTPSLLQAAIPHIKKEKIFWLPHGNSDKGWKKPFFEALQNDLTALVYGQKMIDFMHQKNVRPKIIRIGNFRWRYYLENKSFYKRISQKEIGSLFPKNSRNFLYAPTWEDSEDNGSFWNAFPILAGALPSDCNLLVKLHPNTRRRFEPELESLMGRYEEKKNIVFLPEFPPIYSLLTLCDCYIGDMSSIGYDFLKLNRPMFFLNPANKPPETDPSLFLYRCGIAIPPEKWSSLFEFAKSKDIFTSIRKEIYDYTFAPESDPIQAIS